MRHNKVALITGANGDMGRVISTELAWQGAHVVVVVRRHEQGDRGELRYDGAATADPCPASSQEPCRDHQDDTTGCERGVRLHLRVVSLPTR